METVGTILVAIFAFIGLLIANYIRGTKKTAGALVCPLEGSCDTVVHSDYSRLFGIPIETLGMLYYSLIFLTYLYFSFSPTAVPLPVSYFVLALSVAAFLFSMYLTGIQAFVLHHWCTWCLFSASICTIIFVLALLIMDSKILSFLS
jgi:uncharacterized membrane protein